MRYLHCIGYMCCYAIPFVYLSVPVCLSVYLWCDMYPKHLSRKWVLQTYYMSWLIYLVNQYFCELFFRERTLKCNCRRHFYKWINFHESNPFRQRWNMIKWWLITLNQLSWFTFIWNRSNQTYKLRHSLLFVVIELKTLNMVPVNVPNLKFIRMYFIVSNNILTQNIEINLRKKWKINN